MPPGTDIRVIVTAMNVDTDRLTATLRVRRGAALGLRQRATSVTPLPDGWDLVELPASQVDRLADEAAGYGADVVVVEPPAAREAVVARLRTLIR